MPGALPIPVLVIALASGVVRWVARIATALGWHGWLPLQGGAQANANADLDAALVAAARNGDVAEVSRLLEAGATTHPIGFVFILFFCFKKKIVLLWSSFFEKKIEKNRFIPKKTKIQLIFYLFVEMITKSLHCILLLMLDLLKQVCSFFLLRKKSVQLFLSN